MASGTQNLSSKVYTKTQNKNITVNEVVGNDFASHLLASVIVIVKQIQYKKAILRLPPV